MYHTKDIFHACIIPPLYNTTDDGGEAERELVVVVVVVCAGPYTRGGGVHPLLYT